MTKTKSGSRMMVPLFALVAFSIAIAAGTAAGAMEPARQAVPVDLSQPVRLLERIAWQDREGLERARVQGRYASGLEQRYGHPGEVARSNLFNSEAARYLTGILSGRNRH